MSVQIVFKGKNLALALLMASVIWFVSPAPVYALVNDAQITINSPTDIAHKRQALIQFYLGLRRLSH